MPKLIDLIDEGKVGYITSIGVGGFGNILHDPIELKPGDRLIMTVTSAGNTHVRYDITAESDVIFLPESAKQEERP